MYVLFILSISLHVCSCVCGLYICAVNGLLSVFSVHAGLIDRRIMLFVSYWLCIYKSVYVYVY